MVSLFNFYLEIYQNFKSTSSNLIPTFQSKKGEKDIYNLGTNIKYLKSELISLVMDLDVKKFSETNYLLSYKKRTYQIFFI